MAVARPGRRPPARPRAAPPVPPFEVGPPRLQASWAEGRIVVWAGGPGVDATPDRPARVARGRRRGRDRLGTSPCGSDPGPLAAEARSAPISQTSRLAGGVGAGQGGDRIGPSVRWLGEIALWGTELVAQGRMVPVVRGASSGNAGGRQGSGRHRVRWVPALVGRDRLHGLVSRMPTSVVAFQPSAQADAVCRSVLAAVVDAISRAGAGRLVAPAAPPRGTRVRDRRGGPVGTRRPALYRRRRAGRPGRGGPQALGGSGDRQPSRRSDRPARPAPGGRRLVAVRRGDRGGQARPAGGTCPGGGLGDQVPAGGGAASATRTAAPGVAAAEHPAGPGRS